MSLQRTSTRNRSFRLQLEPLEDRLVLATDAVLDWNAVLLDAIRRNQTTPPEASRNLALMHTAIYDAVNAIDRSHALYLVVASAPPGTSPEAATVAAAHRVLTELYVDADGVADGPNDPDKAILDAARTASLAVIPASSGKTAGILLGEAVANEVLRLRRNDGSNRPVEYTPGTDPGDWRPTPPGNQPALLPHWGSVRPFALLRPDQFPPLAPPLVLSTDYVTAFAEVRAVGSLTSTVRTPDQTAIARFWANGAGTSTPPGHWNVVASVVSQAANLTLSQNARLFAALNIALADAAIACWDVKYDLNFWRPITAIREAANDGNPLTPGDPAWEPLLTTPPFPSYTSGHATFSGAASQILAAFFGTDRIAFTLPSENPAVADRTFISFSSAAQESAESRLYAGIHFRFDNEQGLTAGNQIGTFVANNFFSRDPNQDFRWVSRLYRSLLERETPARPDEVRGWVRLLRLGASRDQVVQGFLASLEYREKLVHKLYERLLGRRADPAGLRGWTALLGAGVPETEIVVGIVSSREFLDRARRLSPTVETTEAFVWALFTQVLGRVPVSRAEVAPWVGAILVGPFNQTQVARIFTRSIEFRTQLLNGSASFGGWYRRYLNRAGDAQGIQAWLTHLTVNDSWQLVQRAFLSSVENGRL